MGKTDAAERTVAGEDGIRYAWVTGFVAAGERVADGVRVGECPLLKVPAEPGAAAELRECGRESDLAAVHPREQPRIEEVFEGAHVLPVRVPLGLLTPDQVEQAEKGDLAAAVPTPLGAGEQVRVGGEEMVLAPEFEPLVLPVREFPDAEPAEGVGPPRRPLRRRPAKSGVRPSRSARSSHWSGDTFRSKSLVFRASP